MAGHALTKAAATVAAAAAIALSAAGCVRFSTTADIRPDGSGAIETAVSIKRAVLDGQGVPCDEPSIREAFGDQDLSLLPGLDPETSVAVEDDDCVIRIVHEWSTEQADTVIPALRDNTEAGIPNVDVDGRDWLFALTVPQDGGLAADYSVTATLPGEPTEVSTGGTHIDNRDGRTSFSWAPKAGDVVYAITDGDTKNSLPVLVAVASALGVIAAVVAVRLRRAGRHRA